MIIRPIAHVRCDLDTKFGVPRQSGVVAELAGRVIFEPEYRSAEALRGIEAYSHLWLIWQFSDNAEKGWSPTVRPPILGGNERVGVFATRSSFRPNALALSCVKLEKVDREAADGPALIVSGIDMMDGTPVFDIKPYIPKWDVRMDATGGFTQHKEKQLLTVYYPEALLAGFSEVQKAALRKILAQDPRPAYQKDPERIYGFSYAGREVKFRVAENVLTVLSVE